VNERKWGVKETIGIISLVGGIIAVMVTTVTSFTTFRVNQTNILTKMEHYRDYILRKDVTWDDFDSRIDSIHNRVLILEHEKDDKG